MVEISQNRCSAQKMSLVRRLAARRAGVSLITLDNGFNGLRVHPYWKRQTPNDTLGTAIKNVASHALTLSPSRDVGILGRFYRAIIGSFLGFAVHDFLKQFLILLRGPILDGESL